MKPKHKVDKSENAG